MLGKLACLVLSKNLGGREELEAVKEGEEGRLHQNRSQQNTKQVLIYSQHQIMHGALRRTGLSMASKLWDDNDLATMKMDEYCKDLETQVGNFDKPIWLTRIVRLWHERWEVSKRPGGKGCSVGLHLDEMEND